MNVVEKDSQGVVVKIVIGTLIGCWTATLMANPIEVSNFRFSGEGAGATISDGNGRTADVTINQDSSTKQTYLNYSSFNCTTTDVGSSCNYVFGYGVIPSDTVRVTKGVSSLNFDTNSGGTDFVNVGYKMNCNDTTGCEVLPSDNAGGLIAITWRRNSGWTYSNTGLTSMRSGIFTYKTNGSNELASADVSDSIFMGAAYPYGNGGIGVFRNSVLSILRN